MYTALKMNHVDYATGLFSCSKVANTRYLNLFFFSNVAKNLFYYMQFVFCVCPHGLLTFCGLLDYGNVVMYIVNISNNISVISILLSVI